MHSPWCGGPRGRIVIVLTGDVVAALGSGAAAARTAAGHLAGGATPFHEVRATFLTAVGLTSGAPAVTSTNASRLLGEVGRGRLDQGARADLVLLDGQGTPAVTVVGGRVVHDPDRRFSRA